MIAPRLTFVTGKGGTGKSTVAAALALALSHRYPTTLAELDPRQGAAALLTASKRLHIQPLNAHAELETFIRRIVPVAAISRRMLSSRTFGYVTAALPGLGAFLLLERFRILAGDAALQDHYVVVDGPASGTAVELLGVARGLIELAPAGTLNRLASAVESFLRDAELFGAAIIVAPEQLALGEALETASALRDRLGISSVRAVLNRAVDGAFTRSELGLLNGHPAGALAERRAHEHTLATRAQRTLRQAGLPTVCLPMLFTERIGAEQVAQLAARLNREVPRR